MSARVSVVIPTWNHVDLLTECLESLRAQTYQDIEIIVADDGSTDGTAEVVKRRFPEVHLGPLPVNRGFCVAVNAGIREAHGEYIVLLNNDMTLDPRFLEQLVARADESDAAMFAPLVVWRDDPKAVYSAGDRQRVDGRPESIGFRRALSECVFTDEVFGVSAGAALYRREVFDTVGLFDEQYVAYFEDSDLNFRARLAGFHACFVREALAYHVGSASQGGRTWWRTRQCFRNHALLVIKNIPTPLLVRYLPLILVERLRGVGRVVASARTEFGLARAIGVLIGTGFEIVMLLPHALRERRRIQRARRLTPSQLAPFLTRTRGGS